MSYLIYQGALSRDVARYVEDAVDKYPYILEMDSFPALNDIFSDRSYTSHGEDCMGKRVSEERQGIGFCWIAKDFMGTSDDGFLCLPDKDAYDRVMRFFGPMVLNPVPFHTMIKVD